MVAKRWSCHVCVCVCLPWLHCGRYLLYSSDRLTCHTYLLCADMVYWCALGLVVLLVLQLGTSSTSHPRSAVHHPCASLSRCHTPLTHNNLSHIADLLSSVLTTLCPGVHHVHCTCWPVLD